MHALVAQLGRIFQAQIVFVIGGAAILYHGAAHDPKMCEVASAVPEFRLFVPCPVKRPDIILEMFDPPTGPYPETRGCSSLTKGQCMTVWALGVAFAVAASPARTHR